MLCKKFQKRKYYTDSHGNLVSMSWRRRVSFVVSVVLARLLAPETYGIIAMVLIFITIADIFVSSGFATSLIQKKDSEATDFSIVFYCSLAVSIVIYLVIYILAPFIANFCSESILNSVLRVFALRISLSVYNTIQHTYVSRPLATKSNAPIMETYHESSVCEESSVSLDCLWLCGYSVIIKSY